MRQTKSGEWRVESKGMDGQSPLPLSFSSLFSFSLSSVSSFLFLSVFCLFFSLSLSSVSSVSSVRSLPSLLSLLHIKSKSHSWQLRVLLHKEYHVYTL